MRDKIVYYMNTRIMKANILIGGLLVAVALWACGDNDEASASHAEANWFTLEYDPNAGELDKLIYEIYDETGFPIFYNDTLKTQVRYDKGGIMKFSKPVILILDRRKSVTILCSGMKRRCD